MSKILKSTIAVIVILATWPAYADYDPMSKDFECRFNDGPMALGPLGSFFGSQHFTPSPTPEWNYYFELDGGDWVNPVDPTKYRIWVRKKDPDGWGDAVMQYHGKVVGHGSCQLKEWVDADPVTPPPIN